MEDNLIYDYDQLKEFYDSIWYDLSPEEVNFMSMACRNKYLSEEERKTVKLNNSSLMFNRQIVKVHSYAKFLSKMKQMEASAPYFLDENDNYVPTKALVFYMNINPSSCVGALNEFKRMVADVDFDIQNCFIKEQNKKDDVIEALKHLPSKITTAFQKNRGRKLWLDIDCDVDSKGDHTPESVKAIVSGLGLESHKVIETHGGFHILLKRDELSEKGFNPMNVVERMKETFPNRKEIVINKNAMIPCPGTLQGGFKVRMV